MEQGVEWLSWRKKIGQKIGEKGDKMKSKIGKKKTITCQTSLPPAWKCNNDIICNILTLTLGS